MSLFSIAITLNSQSLVVVFLKTQVEHSNSTQIRQQQYRSVISQSFS